MRRGDFGVEIIPSSGAGVRELDTGHILARPGTVYRLRLRNFGPRFAVVAVEVDGRTITSGGLVLRPWSYTDLERPVDDGETGRFTVAAEGDEKVFGADGGRDNDELGLIRASFRRELRSGRTRPDLPDGFSIQRSAPFGGHFRYPSPASIDAIMAPSRVRSEPFADIERAAGTGLTGHSDQQFVPATLGPLEDEATVIQLRLVIGSEAAIAAAPVTIEDPAPARPAARP